VATRMYLSATLAPPTGSNPAFDAGWATTASAVRRSLLIAKDSADTLANGASISSTAGQNALHRQYVSQEMAAENAFTTATTFSCQIRGLESAANDNIINRVRRVAIYSQSGATLQSTLIAIGNATSVVEWNTSLRNLTYLNATASTANYTTVYGDRLVIEVGHNDSSGITIAGTTNYGSSGASDLTVDETDTAADNPWFETSLNIVWLSPVALESYWPQPYQAGHVGPKMRQSVITYFHPVAPAANPTQVAAVMGYWPQPYLTLKETVDYF